MSLNPRMTVEIIAGPPRVQKEEQRREKRERSLAAG